MFRAVWVSAVYLVLMIPWEQKYYEGVALPLQRYSAVATEKFLALVGYEQVSQDMLPWFQDHVMSSPWVCRVDNALYIESMGKEALVVAGPCSGLHLLFAFVALGVMLAFIYRRPLWERLLIIVSSVPIAVFCNFVRVTLMAHVSDDLFFARRALEAGTGTWAAWFSLQAGQLEAARQAILDPESFAHQSFGFVMLALAFLLMWAELKFVDRLFVSDEEEKGPTDKPQADGATDSGPSAPERVSGGGAASS